MYSALSTAHGGGHVQQETRDPAIKHYTAQEPCNDENSMWRNSTTIDDVEIDESLRCNPDNPYTVAASVKGTNNVQMNTLKASGLSKDAVVKKNDRDGDGDPDDIYVTLEIMGVNEGNESDLNYEVAPGIEPSFWTFAPKTRGIINQHSNSSNLIRMPSPAIRVEENDRIYLEIENTHYMPHKFNIKGLTKSYEVSEPELGNSSTWKKSKNDIIENPIDPGESKIYKIKSDQPKSVSYQSFTTKTLDTEMGLKGMFIVEENKSDNHLQTLNIGGGKVRHISNSETKPRKSSEYDLIYQALDEELHQIPKRYNDIRKLSKKINRDYDVTDSKKDYYLLNGKSFPYTLRESMINLEKNHRFKLNTLNIGEKTVSLHIHGANSDEWGYKRKKTKDKFQNNMIRIEPGQNKIISLNITDSKSKNQINGSRLLHDHRKGASSTNGISPGGNIGFIADKKYLDEQGMPKNLDKIEKYFSEAYYEGKVPYFQNIDKEKFGMPPGKFNRSISTNDEKNDDGYKNGNSYERNDNKLKSGGLVTNENENKLPPGCSKISENNSIFVVVGSDMASGGDAFSYSTKIYNFGRCERVTIEFANNNEVRHQWMLEGLPEETYPNGIFNIEADGGETIKGTFITPSKSKKLKLFSSIPQHEQKGMQGTIKISGENEKENGFINKLKSFLSK